jgi:hypothetical protein
LAAAFGGAFFCGACACADVTIEAAVSGRLAAARTKRAVTPRDILSMTSSSKRCARGRQPIPLAFQFGDDFG